MATKRYNQKLFEIDLKDGRKLSFSCWTTDTRQGFCHTVYCYERDETSKVSYINRTWECYTYQTALRRAFDKLPKEQRAICELWDFARENKGREECEAFVNKFKEVYDKTPEWFKEKAAASDLMIHTEEQANGMLALMQLATLLS